MFCSTCWHLTNSVLALSAQCQILLHIIISSISGVSVNREGDVSDLKWPSKSRGLFNIIFILTLSSVLCTWAVSAHKFDTDNMLFIKGDRDRTMYSCSKSYHLSKIVSPLCMEKKSSCFRSSSSSISQSPCSVCVSKQCIPWNQSF